MKGMFDMMQKAQAMQANIKRLQDELGQQQFSAVSGGGLVTATVTGTHQLVKLAVKPEALADAALLEDLVCAAVNEAVGKANSHMQSEMSKVTGGLKLPF